MMLKDCDELARYLDGEQSALATCQSAVEPFNHVMPVVAFLLEDAGAVTATNPCDYWQRAKPIVRFLITNPLARAFLPAKLISFLTTWEPVIDGMCPAS